MYVAVTPAMALFLIGCKICKFLLDSSDERVNDLEILNYLIHRKDKMLFKIFLFCSLFLEIVEFF
jgi:hypothetical protein